MPPLSFPLTTFAQAILDAASEPIDAIVVGAYQRGYPDDDGGPTDDELDQAARAQIPILSPALRGHLLSWPQVQPALSYPWTHNHDSRSRIRYGHAFTAWTATKVLTLWHHDCYSRIVVVPRHPLAGVPDAPPHG